MNFEDLKNAVSGETVLVDGFGAERFFLGFNTSKAIIITERLYDGGGVTSWTEDNIKDWKNIIRTLKINSSIRFRIKSGSSSHSFIHIIKVNKYSQLRLIPFRILRESIIMFVKE